LVTIVERSSGWVEVWARHRSLAQHVNERAI
jgi:hypothetical protein